ncbi:MAG: GTP-binding protein, partial [Vescimonas sp.]
HHHHHHADEVFTSWGEETVKPFTEAQLHQILTALDGGDYGQIVRAKGIVPAADGKWLHFDYVPEEHEVRFGPADYTGRLCVIGANLDEHKLHELFGL